MTRLFTLPNELILHITSFLRDSDLLESICACQQLHDVLIPILYHRGLVACPGFELETLPALVWAARQNNKKTVENVFRYTNPPPRLQCISLARAITSRHTSMARLLLDRGAPPNRPPQEEGAERRRNDDEGRTMSIPAPHTPLWAATRLRSLEVTQILLAAGADPNQYSLPELAQILASSAKGGDIRIAEALLRHGLNAPRDSFLPFVAQKGCSAELISLLANDGYDINARDHNGRTPLALAVFHQNAPLATALLSRGARTDIPDNEGNYPIHYAASQIDLGVLKELLDAGADPNVYNDTNQTPLYLASRNVDTRPSILEALLSAGADLAAQNPNPHSRSILLNAVNTQNRAHIRLVLNAGMGRIPSVPPSELMLAATFLADEATVRTLLDTREDVDLLRTTDKHGNNPLMRAARDGSDGVVRMLLPHYYTVDWFRNSQGLTALHLAVASKKPSTVRLLLERSRSHNVQDTRGFIPLMIAVQDRVTALEMAQLLLGEDDLVPLGIDRNRQTALHHAVRGGNAECVRLLLERKAMRTTRSNHGETPFMLAVMLGEVAVVRVFLDVGQEDLERRDQNENTVLMMAALRGNLEIVRMLVEAGADVEATKSERYGAEVMVVTARDQPASYMDGYEEMIQLLSPKSGPG